MCEIESHVLIKLFLWKARSYIFVIIEWSFSGLKTNLVLMVENSHGLLQVEVFSTSLVSFDRNQNMDSITKNGFIPMNFSSLSFKSRIGFVLRTRGRVAPINFSSDKCKILRGRVKNARKGNNINTLNDAYFLLIRFVFLINLTI